MTKEKYEIYHFDINSNLSDKIRRLNENTESAMKRCFLKTI